MRLEAFLKGRGRRAEWDGVIDRPFARGLDDGIVRRTGHAHIHAIPAGPGGGDDLLARESQAQPDWLGGGRRRFRGTVNQVATDGRAEAADIEGKWARNEMKGVRDDIVFCCLRTCRDSNVADGRERRRNGLIDVRAEAFALQQTEAFVRIERAASKILIDKAGRGAVE